MIRKLKRDAIDGVLDLFNAHWNIGDREILWDKYTTYHLKYERWKYYNDEMIMIVA